ncbi:MAG TPA: hypothetical protein VIL16_33095 [Trebonia sp.]
MIAAHPGLSGAAVSQRLPSAASKYVAWQPPPCNATSRLPPAVPALAVRACRLRPVAASSIISMVA